MILNSIHSLQPQLYRRYIIIYSIGEIPVFKYAIRDHANIKEAILKDIMLLGIHSRISEGEKISNTDWAIPSNYKRKYFDNILENIKEVVNKVNADLKYPEHLKLGNRWFQQYAKNDFHDWHIHGDSVLTCVYYVDIDATTPTTSYKLFDKEYEFDINIKEGDVLIFPSFLLHCSKPNVSDKTKTIIAFNLH